MPGMWHIGYRSAYVVVVVVGGGWWVVGGGWWVVGGGWWVVGGGGWVVVVVMMVIEGVCVYVCEGVRV